MPNPKRRHSHQRTAKRRTNYVTDMPEVQLTKNEGSEAMKLRHHATPDGYFKGRRLPGYRDRQRGQA